MQRRLQYRTMISPENNYKTSTQDSIEQPSSQPSTKINTSSKVNPLTQPIKPIQPIPIQHLYFVPCKWQHWSSMILSIK